MEMEMQTHLSLIRSAVVVTVLVPSKLQSPLNSASVLYALIRAALLHLNSEGASGGLLCLVTAVRSSCAVI